MITLSKLKEERDALIKEILDEAELKCWTVGDFEDTLIGTAEVLGYNIKIQIWFSYFGCNKDSGRTWRARLVKCSI